MQYVFRKLCKYDFLVPISTINIELATVKNQIKRNKKCTNVFFKHAFMCMCV